MNSTPTCVLISLLLMMTTACKKKNVPDSPASSAPPNGTAEMTHYDDYTMLQPGNYWVYDYYELDSLNGYAKPEGIYDSAYVEKDTVINFRKYHKYVNVGFKDGSHMVTYIRDSLSYTVNSGGHIMFSSEDFTNIFTSRVSLPTGYSNGNEDDTVTVTEMMGLKGETTAVPAGVFVTSAFRRKFRYVRPYASARIRFADYRYAKDIGLVRQTIAFDPTGQTVFEKRLVRYHVGKN